MSWVSHCDLLQNNKTHHQQAHYPQQVGFIAFYHFLNAWWAVVGKCVTFTVQLLLYETPYIHTYIHTHFLDMAKKTKNK